MLVLFLRNILDHRILSQVTFIPSKCLDNQQYTTYRPSVSIRKDLSGIQGRAGLLSHSLSSTGVEALLTSEKKGNKTFSIQQIPSEVQSPDRSSAPKGRQKA